MPNYIPVKDKEGECKIGSISFEYVDNLTSQELLSEFSLDVRVIKCDPYPWRINVDYYIDDYLIGNSSLKTSKPGHLGQRYILWHTFHPLDYCPDEFYNNRKSIGTICHITTVLKLLEMGITTTNSVEWRTSMNPSPSRVKHLEAMGLNGIDPCRISDSLERTTTYAATKGFNFIADDK